MRVDDYIIFYVIPEQSPCWFAHYSNFHIGKVVCITFFKKINLFIYLFLAVLGLCCCVRASHCGGFSCCAAQAVGTWASVAVAYVLSSCGARA